MKPLAGFSLALAALAAAAPIAADAQNYPNKMIRVVVPFSPGSGLDTTGRLVSQKLSEAFSQAVVVDNRPGANGEIGSLQVSRSAPDGYVLLLGTTSTHASAVHTSKNLAYDPIKDFTPIAATVSTVVALNVHPSVPAKTAKELIDYAKRNPGKLSYSSPGIGNGLHLIGEMFNAAAGVDIVHVPYKGSAPSAAALVSGEVQISYNGMPESLPNVRAGKIRMLAITESERYPAVPEVPTLNEMLPGFERPPGWFGFFGPPALPRAIVSRLNVEIVKAINAPDVKPKLEQSGLAVIAGTPEQFADLLKRSIDLYGKAVKIAGVKPE
jgi:tripartite-type tricarboxylate transporter receptor subunit TctC